MLRTWVPMSMLSGIAVAPAPPHSTVILLDFQRHRHGGGQVPELETKEVRSRRTGGRYRVGCPVLSLDILTYTEESSPRSERVCHLYLLLSPVSHLN